MHPDRPHYDVVVVGARPAGAATAMLLARARLRVLVVDRSRYGADTLSTHALLRGGVLQLHRWGLLDRLVEAGTPAVRRTTFRYDDGEVVIAIKPSHGVDALYAPRRTILDPLLVDAAAEAGAEVRYGVTVVGLRSDRRGRVAGIDGRDDAGRPLAVDAGLVIGADGLHSTVARQVGAPVLHTGRGASAVVYGYWADVATDGYEWIFRPDACAGVIPTNDGLACVFAGATPARIGRRARCGPGWPRPASGAAAEPSSRPCSHRRLPPPRTGCGPAPRRPASAPSRGIPASCGRRGGRGGPSSAMPATGRIPSAPTG